MRPTRQIRLYPNRRLYDPSVARYIKYDDILDLLCKGFDVVVTDSVNGRDCTNTILVDILVREESLTNRPAPRLLTDAALKELICLGASERARLIPEFLKFALQSASEP